MRPPRLPLPSGHSDSDNDSDDGHDHCVTYAMHRPPLLPLLFSDEHHLDDDHSTRRAESTWVSGTACSWRSRPRSRPERMVRPCFSQSLGHPALRQLGGLCDGAVNVVLLPVDTAEETKEATWRTYHHPVAAAPHHQHQHRHQQQQQHPSINISINISISIIISIIALEDARRKHAEGALNYEYTSPFQESALIGPGVQRSAMVSSEARRFLALGALRLRSHPSSAAAVRGRRSRCRMCAGHPLVRAGRTTLHVDGAIAGRGGDCGIAAAARP